MMNRTPTAKVAALSKGDVGAWSAGASWNSSYRSGVSAERRRYLLSSARRSSKRRYASTAPGYSGFIRHFDDIAVAQPEVGIGVG